MNPVIIGNATRIYALCEFPSQVPRYVGKTIQPLRLRLVAHLRSARRGPRLPVSWWLAKREKAGKQVCIKWLETVDAGGDWQERERFWIAKHRADGAALLNLTDGGEGLAGHRFAQAHKDKIAAALRTGSHFNCIACQSEFWRKLSAIKRGHSKFCSRQCANKYNKGGFRDAS